MSSAIAIKQDFAPPRNALANPFLPLRRRAIAAANIGEVTMTDHPPIIEAKGLKRRFKGPKGKTIDAVRGIDLTVREGEIVGFLGPNGAGKTTTLKMLTTLLAPTAIIEP